MHSEERYKRLDDLLDQRVEPLPEDKQYRPQIDAAARLNRYGRAQPRVSFGDKLEHDLLSANEVFAGRDAAPPVQLVPWAGSLRETLPTRIRQPRRRSTRRHALWGTLAAACLIVVLVGLSTAVASAKPGDVLYAVRRIVQHVQAQLTEDPYARADLQISNATDSLHTLEASIAAPGHPNYSDDRIDFKATLGDATAAVAAVSAGDQRSQLDTRLASLRSTAASDMYNALPSLTWDERLGTTKDLVALGMTGPTITSVTYGKGTGTPGVGQTDKTGPEGSQSGSGTVGKSDGLTLIIHGSGFVAGAVVYINGHKMGDVRKVTSSVIQVVLSGFTSLRAGTTIGVGNPDGLSTQKTWSGRGDQAAGQEVLPTVTSGSHSGSMVGKESAGNR